MKSAQSLFFRRLFAIEKEEDWKKWYIFLPQAAIGRDQQCGVMHALPQMFPEETSQYTIKEYRLQQPDRRISA